MLKAKEYKESVNSYLSILKNFIELQNENGCFDINKYCEDFFCDLLNMIYELDLENLNAIKVNFPAVDLGDSEEGICYQVTSENSIKKIEKTVGKFIEHKLYDQFEELIILVLGKKKNYKKTIDTKGKFDFSIEDNVIDLNDLSKKINLLKRTKMQEVLKYLEENIDIKSKQPSYLSNISEEHGVFTGECKRYLDYCKIDSKEEAECIVNHIKGFIESVEQFDKNTREIVYGIIKSRVSFDSSGVYFNGVKLKKYLKIENKTLNEELKILLDANYLTTSDESGQDNHSLNYYTSDGWEVFSDLIRYCEKGGISIKEMIVDLDFTLLD